LASKTEGEKRGKRGGCPFITPESAWDAAHHKKGGFRVSGRTGDLHHRVWGKEGGKRGLIISKGIKFSA